MSILELFEAVNDLELEVDPNGNNVRLRAGETSTFNVEGKTWYISVPSDGLSLTRLSLYDQKGMSVLRGVIGIKGEQIGLMNDGDVKIPAPPYHKAAFTTWRTYVHFLNYEFMNVDADAVAALKALADSKGFVPFVPRQNRNRPEYVRAEGSSIEWDVQAPGTTVPQRFVNGIHLDTATFVTGKRVAPNMVEFLNRNTGNDETRPGFTSFIDTVMPNTESYLKAIAEGDPSNLREATNRLSALTGHNSETGFPLRPTLGFCTPTGKDEIRLFPPIEEESAEQTAPEDAPKETKETKVKAQKAETKAAVAVSEEPFE